MKITITHLSPFGSDNFCAAGVSLDSSVRKYVRLLQNPRPKADQPLGQLPFPDQSWLYRNNKHNVFGIGCTLSVSSLDDIGERPFVEDSLVSFCDMQLVEPHISPNKFCEMLASHACSSANEAMGSCVTRYKDYRLVIPYRNANVCKSSLCIIKASSLSLLSNSQGKYFIRDSSLVEKTWYSVNDIRLHYKLLNRPWKDAIEVFNEKYSGREAYLAIGLAGPFKGYYWLQATNIYPVEDPYWRVVDRHDSPFEYEVNK